MSYKIINIGGMVVNNYIVVTEAGCMAIDTGYAGGFDTFRRRLSEHSLGVSDIRYIFLTHAHDDHAGFLNELLDATDATIVLHKDAPERLRKGQNSFEGGCTSKKALTVCKILTLFGKGKHLFPSVKLSGKIVIAEQEAQPLDALGLEAKILLLPGHTADSIGLLLPDGTLFCGDTAMNGPGMTARHPIFLENLEDHRKTWDAITACGAGMLFPAHGKPFPVKDLIRFRHYLDGKRLHALKEY